MWVNGGYKTPKVHIALQILEIWLPTLRSEHAHAIMANRIKNRRDMGSILPLKWVTMLSSSQAVFSLRHHDPVISPDRNSYGIEWEFWLTLNTISDETVPSLMSTTLQVPRTPASTCHQQPAQTSQRGNKRGKLLLASGELLLSTSQRAVYMLGRHDDFDVGPASMTSMLPSHFVLQAGSCWSVYSGWVHPTSLLQGRYMMLSTRQSAKSLRINAGW
jgi:hypothetical protein